MNELERHARRDWLTWAQYRKWTYCDGCAEHAYCGAKKSAGPWLCVSCYDQR